MKVVPVAQVEALIKLLYPEEMTPTAKRQIESALSIAENVPDMEHYTRAIDEIWRLRRALAYEAQVVEAQSQDVKTLSNRRKEILAKAAERMKASARGESEVAYAGMMIVSLRNALRLAGASETLTRHQFEEEAVTR